MHEQDGIAAARFGDVQSDLADVDVAMADPLQFRHWGPTDMLWGLVA